MFQSNKSSILKDLEKQGLCFTESVQKSIGTYLLSDADWNYRDIPHLNFMHSQAEASMVFATEDLTSSLLVQQIGPIKIVLTIVLLSSPNNSQLYYTSVGPAVLVVETKWESQSNFETLVTTTYAVGTPKFLKFAHRLIHKILARNYKILMSEDLPMRNQRANLREKGYTFRQDRDGHSYVNSLKTAKDNVVSPHLNSDVVKVSLLELTAKPIQFFSTSRERELVVWKNGTSVKIGSSFCHHEGANLVGQKCSELGIVCPWHGRTNSPMGSIDLSTGKANVPINSNIADIRLEGEFVSVHLKEITVQ